MDIFKMISDQILKDSTIQKIGESVGVKPEKVVQIVKLGMPTILQALGRNANTVEGSKALFGALEQHENDEVDDIDGFLGSVDTIDGAKILNHVFQGKNDSVQKNLAKKAGVDDLQVSGIMTQLAPLLMGILGQQKKKQNIDSSNISNLLDFDTDGDIMDDLGKLVGGFLEK